MSTELQPLSLPKSTKEEISIKISMGVPADGILHGINNRLLSRNF